MSRQRPKVKYEAPMWHRKTPREMLKEPLSTECDAGRDNIFKVRRDTIAIVFVPGIMGSKLRKINGKREPVWNPDAAGFMMNKYLRAKPEQRYDLLIKDRVAFRPDLFCPKDRLDDDLIRNTQLFWRCRGADNL